MTREVFMQVGARHISQLGRELVTDYVTALTELVKNSYDADSEAVEIKFENLKSNDGRIIIIDTGSGFSSSDIVNKWAIIGTNNKLRDTYSAGYKRRYAGQKGIGRFAVERLAEHCKIISFTENERFEYFNNWNLYEGINIPEFIQRCEILKSSDDISSAKYLKCAIEYLLLTDSIALEDKKTIEEFFGTSEIVYNMFLGNPLKVDAIKNHIIPIMEKYKDDEQMIQDVKSLISDGNKQDMKKYYDMLVELYRRNKINKKSTTGTIMVLEHLRDQWQKSDIEKIMRELVLLVAPSKSLDDNFRIYINADEFENLERVELTNEVLDLAYAELKAYFVDEKDDDKDEYKKLFVMEYKENKSSVCKIEKIDVDSPFLCGEFKMHLYYFVRDQKYLKIGTIAQSIARKILDAFCGVKVYRDGFRIRPYGDAGNDWLLLDSRKIKDTHGYLVGNNQLIGEVEVSQQGNPLLIDSTNREAIIENESFSQLRLYVLRAIQMIQNVRYDKFKEEEKQKKDKQMKLEAEARRQQAQTDEEVKKYLNEIDDAATRLDVARVVDISTQIAGVVATERKKSERLLSQTKDWYEEQILSKERELSLYKNLASMGILAGSFGHETVDIFARINNDIGYIRDYCNLKCIYDDVATSFTRLSKDLNRVSSYSKLLLSFLKKSKRDKMYLFNWGTATKNIIDLYRKILESFDIEIDLSNIEDMQSPLKMFQIDFESIIVNLITNAFEALKNKDKKTIRVSIINKIIYGEIIVEDSGNGIADDKLDWVFKPFNTTKKEDGVGLGLTIVRDLVDKYKGDILIGRSSLGGAKFTIKFNSEEKHD